MTSLRHFAKIFLVSGPSSLSDFITWFILGKRICRQLSFFTIFTFLKILKSRPYNDFPNHENRFISKITISDPFLDYWRPKSTVQPFSNEYYSSNSGSWESWYFVDYTIHVRLELIYLFQMIIIYSRSFTIEEKS